MKYIYLIEMDSSTIIDICKFLSIGSCILYANQYDLLTCWETGIKWGIFTLLRVSKKNQDYVYKSKLYV